MTDEKLLTLAAKAAGHKKQWHEGWDPLTNDGDALRLAVKLRLRVRCPTTDTDCALASNGDVVAYSEDDLNDTPMADLYAATRRAIVRAAAEIGKAMPCRAKSVQGGEA
jgi:hypothetical protein